MKTKVKKFLSILISLLIVFTAAGCGNNKEQNETNNTADTESTSETPKRGGSISIYSYKPDTLCPLLSLNNANLRMLNIVYDGLFTIDENMNVLPCLALSWTKHDNNTRYVVNLRENVLFHDGSLLVPEDVIFSVDTIKSEPKSPYYHNVSVIKDVKEAGANSVEFILTKPLANFVNLLDFPIIKKQAEEIDKENYAPNGTGGFILEDRNEGNLLHLVRNDNWWGGEIYLDSVTVRLLPDKDTAIYAFSSGDITFCPAESDDWGKFVDTKTSAYKEYKTEYYNFIGLNNKSSLFSDEETRRALLNIIDREEVLKSGVPSFCEPSNAPVRSDWVYLKEEKNETAKNLDEARKLLEDAGWSIQDGVYKRRSGRRNIDLRVEILVNEESYKKERFAQKAAEQLSEFGIEAEVKKLPYDQYIKAVNSGKYDMFVGSINLSKELDFEFLLGEGNMFFANDEELLKAAADMQLCENENDFSESLNNFVKLFNEKVPFIGLGFENSVLLYKSNIKGEINPLSNNIYNGMEKIYMTE